MACGHRGGERAHDHARRDERLAEARDERDAEPGGDERHHRVVVERAVRERGREARGGAAVDGHVVARGPVGRPDERLRGQRAQVDRIGAGERVRRGQDGVERVDPQREPLVARVVDRRREPRRHRERDVGVAAGHRHEAARGLLLGDRQGELGVGAAQRGRGGRDDLRDAGREAGDPDAADEPVRVGGDVGRGGLELREHDVGVADQDLGGAGEPHAAAVALDDGLADLALERGELLGHGRGREVERVGRGGDRAVLGDLAQDAQPADVDHAADLTDATRNVYWL